MLRPHAPFVPVLALALSLFASLACTSASDTPSTPAAPAVSAAPVAETAPGPEARAARPIETAGELRFTAQPGWVVETPTSSMRKAQYRLPSQDGAGAASLVVYHFGAGGGGGVEANLARWAGQFEQPDGSDSRAAMKSSTRTRNGLAVTEVELAGTYVAETSPGSGERVREEGWRMLAAILEAQEGAYYVKLVGPAETVAHWEASYAGFLEDVER